ncbi:hypothetical protein ACFPAF_13835 [Hymenobacter endophyticus]|uniref:Uncharacterized protein n=1 Tax=Hymenobacter endophyticus TaxID=3076335 RepID=A0ABU3TJE0_9BACT|nr:hypothetical protein [Hymenobacter endophyticus]MDU0371482.1 hypothetical protein [Hymenobacter endophyticus]
MSTASYAPSISPSLAGAAVCALLKGSKQAGLTLGLQLMKKSKKRNPT